MSRASISTGNITFTSKEGDQQRTPKARDDEAPMHIAILADFSGRQSQGVCEADSISSRKAIEVDRDNFEEVFEKLNVSLQLAVSGTPLKFCEFDDLHPDFLYRKIDLFEQFHALKFKLNKPELFQDAADEILSWQNQQIEAKQTPYEEGGIPLPENMLDAVLSQHHRATQENKPENDIQQLIKSIVAPYALVKTDPRLPEFESAIDEATAHTLRKILHASTFQDLEANWLGLYFLIRRIETSSKLKIFIYDISPEEIIDDTINCETSEQTQLYKLLVEQRQMPGCENYAIVQCNMQMEDDIDHCQVARLLADIAAQSQSLACASASENIAGCESIANTPDPDDWHYDIDASFSEAWHTLRNSEASQHLALCAPRFMLRLPYGKSTSPIESFDFEELPEYGAHPYYCWGNSAHLLTLLLAQSYSQSGWQFVPGQLQQVDELPLHVYREYGEAHTKACAEITMTDRAANALAEQGILSVRSVKEATSVILSNMRSLSAKGSLVFSNKNT
ncbi:MAG: type VI secretion system contractile sheath large subunit [Agarilytica sp.]